MRTTNQRVGWTLGLMVSGSLLLAVSAAAMKPPEDGENVRRGKALYERSCIFCHGVAGAGDGPAAFFIGSYKAPRPRDFRTGIYKFRTTPTGEPPTDQDLFRTLSRGIPGYMPTFKGLTESERWQVIYYIKSYSDAFAEEPEEPVKVGSPILSTPESIERGRKLYKLVQCWQCHGPGGQGNGPQVPDLRDNQGLPIRPRDLTNPTTFGNGQRRVDVYRTLMTGLDGTPMPSYADAFSGKRAVEVWHLVNYVLSLSGR